MSQASKIMVIRHAEKPTGNFAGVNVKGVTSNHDLIVRGWQRAGALACLFRPAHGPLQNELLATPAFIFASAPAVDPQPGDSKSHRPEETVTPLAQLLNIVVDLRFSKGQEEDVAQAAKACKGPVLIAWQHETIQTIANAILGSEQAPQNWPSDRFDMVFVFTFSPAAGKYSFAQAPQCLLVGDTNKSI